MPWYMRRECSLASAGVELARACNGKKSCRISTRAGKDDIFSRNPCNVRQRPFATMKYVCETQRGNMLRSYSENEEDIIYAEDEDNSESDDDEMYANYIMF